MIPKFRAYDKERGMMNVNGFFNNFLIVQLFNNDYSTYMEFVDQIELMQSTGLEDMNGLKVYQGDIVKCTCGCPHEVIWAEEHGGTFIGGMPGWYLSGLNEGYSWTGEEEVIGNVWENPELWEEVKK